MTIISPQCCCDGLPATCRSSDEETQLFLDATGLSTLARTGNDQQMLNLPDLSESLGACAGGAITTYYDYFGPADQTTAITAGGQNAVNASIFVGNGNYLFPGPNPFGMGWSVETTCHPSLPAAGTAITDYTLDEFGIRPQPSPFIGIGSGFGVSCGPSSFTGGGVHRVWSHNFSVGFYLSVILATTLYPGASTNGAFGSGGPWLTAGVGFGSAWQQQSFGSLVPRLYRVTDATTQTSWLFQEFWVNWQRLGTQTGATFYVSLTAIRSGILGQSTDHLFDPLPLVPTVANSEFPDPLGLMVGTSQLS